MPTMPPTACSTPGCPGRAVDRGRCPSCRQTTTERGYGAEHQAEARSARNGAQCEACGSTDNLQRDHRIPTSLGGSQVASNKRWLCVDCHGAVGLKSNSRQVLA